MIGWLGDLVLLELRALSMTGGAHRCGENADKFLRLREKLAQLRRVNQTSSSGERTQSGENAEIAEELKLSDLCDLCV